MIHWRWLELKQESVAMTFGERLRELRKAKNLGQRALADMVDINFTYLSKIENGRLDFAQFPSEDLIRKLAKALDADEDELLHPVLDVFGNLFCQKQQFVFV